MRKNYFLLALLMLFSSLHVFAQNVFVKQVIVASGGNFSDPDDYVTLGSYNPSDSTTTQFGTVFTQSVQDAVIYDHYLYVAAQDSIVAYDIDNYQRVAAIAAAGVHRLAATQEKLIVSFWYPVTENFVRIYNREDLSELALIPGVSGEAAGIAVYDGRAYVAVPGGYSSATGKVAIIDLNTNSLLLEYDLGELGARINDLYIYEEIYKGNNISYLISVNSSEWNGTTGVILKYNMTENSLTSSVLNVNLGKGVGINYENGGTLYAVINGGIGAVSLQNLTVTDTSVVQVSEYSIAGAAYDRINERFYVATTDYYSMGQGTIYDDEGDVVGSFDAGISPEALAIDYRDNTAISQVDEDVTYSVYPNPAKNVIFVSGKEGKSIDKIKIFDLTGKVVKEKSFAGKGLSQVLLNVSDLNGGLYLLTVEAGNNVYTTKIVIK